MADHDPDPDFIWHIAMNPRKHECGCAEWEQWSVKAQSWVHKTFQCALHEAR